MASGHEQRRRAVRWRAAAAAPLLWLLTLSPAGAAEPDPIAELKREIEALRREYGERLAALEARLAALEAARAEAGTAERSAAEAAEGELEALRAAAREAAGEAPAAAVAEVAPPTVGRERNLNRLNPEISFSGDLLGLASDRQREEFEAREFELAFQSTLDPFSYTKWFVAVGPEGEAELEEGYIAYTGLPGGLTLAGGKMRQSFGVLNRWHQHALPQPDYPLPLTATFGDEGLAQTGVSLAWLLPRPWASANELTVQVTDGENEAFGGESFERLAVLAHLKNYWDLGPAAYFEWGLSGIAGDTESGGASRVWGTDLTFHWQPPARAKYRELTWRSELFLSQRDDAAGRRHEALGLYTYLEGLVARNLYAGLLYDRAEDPAAPDRVRWSLFPYLSWWQSEWVRLRAGYSYLEDDFTAAREERLILQLTWAAGPHKHEEY